MARQLSFFSYVTWGFAALAPLGFFIGSSLLPDKTPAHLVLPMQPYQIGEGRSGEVVHGTIKVANSGGEPLTFRMTAGCGCTELTPTEGVVPPRSDVIVNVGVRLEAVWGADRDVAIHIGTNDPDHLEQQFWIVAACPTPFSVSPTQVDFGTCQLNQAKVFDLVVRSPEEKPFPSGAEPACVLESNVFRVQHISSKPSELTVQVEMAAQAEPALLEGSLQITASTGETLKIPIRAETVGEFVCTPRVLRMPAEGRSKQRLMVWRSDGRSLEAATEILAPDGATVQDITPPGSSRRIFEVMLDATTKQVFPASTIQMIFRGSHSAVSVTVKPR